MQIVNIAFSWEQTLITGHIFDIESFSVILFNVFFFLFFFSVIFLINILFFRTAVLKTHQTHQTS